MFELSMIAFISALVLFFLGKQKKINLLYFYALVLFVLSIAGFVTVILKNN